MADFGVVQAAINGLSNPQDRVVMQRIFRLILPDLRFGHPANATPAVNFGGRFLAGTTGSIAGDVFTLEHGLERVPYLVVPVLHATHEGAQLVPLRIARTADTKRLYFTSTETDTDFAIYVEG